MRFGGLDIRRYWIYRRACGVSMSVPSFPSFPSLDFFTQCPVLSQALASGRSCMEAAQHCRTPPNLGRIVGPQQGARARSRAPLASTRCSSRSTRSIRTIPRSTSWRCGRPRPLWRRSPHASFARSPRVGSNGGTAAGLVGDYDTVARRIAEFDRAGVELFMLEFQPFEDDMRRFAQELVPRVRRELAA